jgi:hypothetical protein
LASNLTILQFFFSSSSFPPNQLNLTKRLTLFWQLVRFEIG